ncbi:hypothetical protein HK096_009591, partial [Nowakowskiella sp. JEL0078]
ICVDPIKYERYLSIKKFSNLDANLSTSDLTPFLSTDPFTTRIHCCAWCAVCIKKSSDGNLIIIKPSTLWWRNRLESAQKGFFAPQTEYPDYVEKSSGNYWVCLISPKFVVHEITNIQRVFYSFHSSLEELRAFVEFLEPSSIFPCVIKYKDSLISTNVVRHLQDLVKYNTPSLEYEISSSETKSENELERINEKTSTPKQNPIIELLLSELKSKSPSNSATTLSILSSQQHSLSLEIQNMPDLENLINDNNDPVSSNFSIDSDKTSDILAKEILFEKLFSTFDTSYAILQNENQPTDSSNFTSETNKISSKMDVNRNTIISSIKPSEILECSKSKLRRSEGLLSLPVSNSESTRRVISSLSNQESIISFKGEKTSQCITEPKQPWNDFIPEFLEESFKLHNTNTVKSNSTDLFDTIVINPNPSKNPRCARLLHQFTESSISSKSLCIHTPLKSKSASWSANEIIYISSDDDNILKNSSTECYQISEKTSGVTCTEPKSKSKRKSQGSSRIKIMKRKSKSTGTGEAAPVEKKEVENSEIIIID